MRDIALVPQHDVLHGRRHIGAHHAGEAGEILRQYRVALVRHRRGAFLAFGEEFLRFQHFGALQVPDLGGKALNRRCDHAEGCKIHGVAVARDHLGRDRLRRQSHRLGDMRFDARIDLRECADGAGDRAGRDFLAGGDKPLAGAGELRIGVSEFQPERDRFGMNAVGAADGRRHLVLEGALLQCGENLVDVGDQKIGGAGQLHVEAGIEHVGGGHALMHEARLGADDFRQMGQEGDDVVLGLALDFIDALDVEGGAPGLGPDRLRGLFRNDAEFRQRIGRMRLDLEPDLEARLRLPDGGHFRTGVARNHRRL